MQSTLKHRNILRLFDFAVCRRQVQCTTVRGWLTLVASREADAIGEPHLHCFGILQQGRPGLVSEADAYISACSPSIAESDGYILSNRCGRVRGAAWHAIACVAALCALISHCCVGH